MKKDSKGLTVPACVHEFASAAMSEYSVCQTSAATNPLISEIKAVLAQRNA
jgi:hypothetical protein